MGDGEHDMRLSKRVRKLEAAVPTCEGSIRFVRGEEPLPGAERCRVCGRDHVLVVHEVIVRTRQDVERVRALNAWEGGS